MSIHNFLSHFRLKDHLSIVKITRSIDNEQNHYLQPRNVCLMMNVYMFDQYNNTQMTKE